MTNQLKVGNDSASTYKIGDAAVNKLYCGDNQLWPLSASYVDEVLADDPNWYLRLNESSGSSAVDSSGNSRNGTYVGTPTLGATPLINTGTAVTFSGDDQVDLTHIAGDFTANRTYEAWFSTTNSGVRTVIVGRNLTSQNKTVDIIVESSNILLVRYWRATGAQYTFTTGINVTDGVKRHVVVTIEGATSGTLKIYINGLLNSTHSYADSDDGSPPFCIGASRSANRFVGKIDEVAYYPTVLSASRILAHYNAGVA